jgi:1-acyl-sn-glycerol-3-phosphate acyltransferase
MRGLIGAWRLLRMLVHLAHGMAVMALRFPSLDAGGRHARVQWWSAKLLRTLGIGLSVHGTPRAGATLLVANHVSWLDIAAIHAVAPQARFVSKSDVRQWPLLGRLVAGAGTLFIERESKRDALRVVHQMAQALRAGDMVAVFPEGTTGAGPELLPFHANLLQAAIATATPVQPIVLRFCQPGHDFSPAAQFVGDTTLAQSLWRLACADALAVNLQWLPAHRSEHADRRALAAMLRHAMAESLAANLAHGDLAGGAASA